MSYEICTLWDGKTFSNHLICKPYSTCPQDRHTVLQHNTHRIPKLVSLQQVGIMQLKALRKLFLTTTPPSQIVTVRLQMLNLELSGNQQEPVCLHIHSTQFYYTAQVSKFNIRRNYFLNINYNIRRTMTSICNEFAISVKSRYEEIQLHTVIQESFERMLIFSLPFKAQSCIKNNKRWNNIMKKTSRVND